MFFVQVLAKDVPEIVALLSDLNEKVYLNHFWKATRTLNFNNC